MNTERKKWKVALELLSPMQIGAGSLGMVERTELYIPGRVIWGALTAALTEKHNRKPSADAYIKVGEQIGPPADEFGTFFPSFDRGSSIWHPVETGNGVVWERHPQDGHLSITHETMEQRLLFCSNSTAICPARASAQDDSLHATDLISPLWVQDGTGHPQRTCFTGWIRLPGSVQLDADIIPLGKDEIIGYLCGSRLGGGRKRGWGRILVTDVSLCSNSDRLETFIELIDGRRVLLMPSEVREGHGLVKGRCTLLIHREHCPKRGSGQRFSHPVLAWNVGAVLPPGV